MQHTDDITSHILSIIEMNTILTNICHTVPNKMIISKKLYSLPPSYNNIITAWSNVPDASQTVNNLEERLFWHKSLIQ